jgi:hypothetical protein
MIRSTPIAIDVSVEGICHERRVWRGAEDDIRAAQSLEPFGRGHRARVDVLVRAELACEFLLVFAA